MALREILLKIYWRIQSVIIPKLKYSQYLYEDVLRSYVNKDTYWLDIGCGHQIIPDWRLKEETLLVKSCKFIAGIDYGINSLRDHRNIGNKVQGDIHTLPFKSDRFDLVTANMVVEHIENPEIHIEETLRVLKPGGHFILHTSNKNNIYVPASKLLPEMIKMILARMLEGREIGDIFKTYHKMNSKKSIVELASKSGFHVCKIRMIASTPIFAIIIPIAIIELIWIRITMTKMFKPFRSNIIAMLQKSREGENKTAGAKSCEPRGI